MNFATLNEPELAQEGGSEAYRRVLARLGDDIALIVRQLQLRPTAVTRIDRGGRHILVRLTTPGQHVVVRIAADDDLAAELYFGRALAQRTIPTPQIIYADISRTQLPFAYLVETYVGGPRGDSLSEPYQLRGVARQLGRYCRQIHALNAAGWGSPTSRRSWRADSWAAALALVVGNPALELPARLVFGDDLQRRILEIGLALDSPAQPRLVHGALCPRSIVVTAGEQAQLVAIVEPGPLIGGDPLWDLARALNLDHPEPFREGFMSGYLTMPLAPHEQRRLLQLRLLDSYLTACQRYMLAEPHEQSAALARELLSQLCPA